MVEAGRLEPHRKALWALAYRMTGVAADADEIVQDAFVKAQVRPPDLDRPLGGWLRTVVLNLSRDRLRRRRRRPYVGPWLPEPARVDPPSEAPDPEVRFGTAESLSYGFLVALEALTPQQRAVLLVRDVLELDGAEAAAELGLSEGSVRVALHRARRRLAVALSSAAPPDDARLEATRHALAGLLGCLTAGDVAGARRWFTDDAVALTDGGGQVFAARIPLVGPDRITRAWIKLAAHARVRSAEWVVLNGLPAVAGRVDARPGEPDRFVQLAEVSAEGRIRRLYSVLTPQKLDRILP